ncbi:type I-E CRISPR-associated protein Cse1/CasA [Streptomyces spectabilis]|uniref:CRISPR system Cascade subunit CasA n=1 Tax=Streptomyces spectabilis TaxID=68270 RepID=A0A7W8ERZ5_STRST|nr:type I-E CRISPR-associated protein Cse1/CasA [Streptomyces spectabilis]MBB5103242.1 CRISPR system Cascade subunit CasA [Streptomyces spectabilis]MCI3902434.1 type I-E CRISPR-associated protein Cse1/CasA [Streptomyces spectabilis]
MRALSLDGEAVEQNLLQLLTRAEELTGIGGMTPGEKVALIEYLLAICYASGAYPSSTEDWTRWVLESQSLRKAAAWLAVQSDEDWDLFHPARPLGQNVRLADFMGRYGTGPAQLVIERAGDYAQFADHHHLEDPEALPAADAFRAMLTQHTFGLAGRARVSGKGTLGPALTNLAAGRLSGRIRVLALGPTLGDTLRLNLAPTADGPGALNLTWTEGPIERRGFTARPRGRAVTGFADLHSYLGRSVLMRPVPGAYGESAAVDRVLVGAGELLELDPELHLQDAVMSATRTGERKPLWPSATRDLWREAHALYAAVEEEAGGFYTRLGKLPKARQLGGHPFALHGRHPFDLLAVGLVSNKSTPVTWVTSVFPFAPGLAPVLHQASSRGSQVAEHIARSLDKAAYSAWEIAYPNPRPTDKKAQLARFDARGEHWKATEEPFHTLLQDVADGELVTDCMAEYVEWLVPMARRALEKRLDSLPGNTRGMRARAAALRRFDAEVTGFRAPDDLKGLNGLKGGEG